MDIVIGVILCFILLLLSSITMMLDRISRTLKNNYESLSRIESHLEQINTKNSD